MRPSTVLFTGVAAFVALAGCSKSDPVSPASAPTAPSASTTLAPPCPPEMPVKIDNVTVPASGTAATIRIDPDPRQIGQNAGGVRWTLKSPSGKTYEFTIDGVRFKSGAPGGLAYSVPGLTEYVWCFNATPPAQTWPYTIKFVDKAVSTKVWTCDPTIVNSDTPITKAGPIDLTCTSPP